MDDGDTILEVDWRNDINPQFPDETSELSNIRNETSTFETSSSQNSKFSERHSEFTDAPRNIDRSETSAFESSYETSSSKNSELCSEFTAASRSIHGYETSNGTFETSSGENSGQCLEFTATSRSTDESSVPELVLYDDDTASYDDTISKASCARTIDSAGNASLDTLETLEV